MSLLSKPLPNMSKRELIENAKLALELASSESVKRNDLSAPDEEDRQLRPKNPFRDRLLVHNADPQNTLYVGWGDDTVTSSDFSFPIPPDSTYHPPDQSWWNVPHSEMRFAFENNQGTLYYTEWTLTLSEEGKQLFKYIRENY